MTDCPHPLEQPVEVPDAETRELMHEFYDRVSKRVSRMAPTTRRRTLFLASFVLIGRPNYRLPTDNDPVRLGFRRRYVMPILVPCPTCGITCSVPDVAADDEIRCSHCSNVVVKVPISPLAASRTVFATEDEGVARNAGCMLEEKRRRTVPVMIGLVTLAIMLNCGLTTGIGLTLHGCGRSQKTVTADVSVQLNEGESAPTPTVPVDSTPTAGEPSQQKDSPRAQVKTAKPSKELVQECNRLLARVRQLRDAGKTAESIVEADKLLRLEEQTYGPDSAESGNTYTVVAGIHELQDEFGAADKAYANALRLALRHFGEQDYRTRSVRLLKADAARLALLDPGKRARVRGADDQMRNAELLARQKNREASLVVASNAVNTAREILGEESRRTANLIFARARLLDRVNDPDAESAMREALASCKKVYGDHPQYFAALYEAGMFFQSHGLFVTAEPLKKESIALARRLFGKESPTYQAAVTNLSMMYLQMRNYAAAEPLGLEATALCRKLYGQGDPTYAQSLINLAHIQAGRGDASRAIPFLNEALECARKGAGENSPMYAGLLNDVATHFRTVGDYGRAEKTYQEAAERTNKLDAKGPDHAAVLANLGELRMFMGDQERAELVLTQALEIRKLAKNERPQDLALTLILCGRFYLSSGDFARAEQFLTEALDTLRTHFGAEHDACGVAYDALGHLYLQMADYRRAGSFLEMALQVRERNLGSEHPRTGSALVEIAELYRRQDRLDDACMTLQRAQGVMRKTIGQAHPDYATATENLARVYYRMGRLTDAKACNQESLDFHRKTSGEDSPLYAASLRDRAEILMQEGKSEEAHAVLKRVHDIDRKRPHSKARTAETCFLLARSSKSLDRERSREWQMEGMKLEHEMIRSIFAFNSEASMQLALEEMNNSLEVLVSAAAEGAKVGQARCWPSPTASAPPSVLTWTLRRKAILLDTLCRFRVRQGQLAKDPRLAQQVSRWRLLRQRLADVALDPRGMDADAVAIQLADWKQESEKLEASLNRAAASDLGAVADEVDEGRIRAALPAGAALIEILRIRGGDLNARQPAHYFAFVLPGKTADPAPAMTAMIDLGPAAEIDALVGKFRASIQMTPRELRLTAEKDLEAELRKVGSELHRRLIAPLQPHLHDATLLYVAPDGELNRLSFESLSNDKGEYLVELYKIVYLSCGRDLIRPIAASGKGTVVFAGPDYNLKSKERQEQAEKLNLKPGATAVALRGTAMPELRGMRWKRLAGASVEADDIEKALEGSNYGPVKAYRGAEALEEALKCMNRPRVLHLATHGFFLPDGKDNAEGGSGSERGAAGGMARLRKLSNPLLRSGIVLAGANTLGEEGATGEDGWVTAEEISLMDLRGTELVVLSACESGLGDIKAGEGVFGLRRAFLYAGARSLVTSLFEVPDLQTREMMSEFYGGLKAGKTKLDALHDAQRTMIRKRRQDHQAAHPFFWGSFVLVGDPG